MFRNIVKNRRIFYILEKHSKESTSIRCLENTFEPNHRLTHYTHFCTKSLKQPKLVLDNENNPNVTNLQKLLECSDIEAIEIIKCSTKVESTLDIRTINRTVRWLHRNGVTSPTIVMNYHILFMPLGLEILITSSYKKK